MEQYVRNMTISMDIGNTNAVYDKDLSNAAEYYMKSCQNTE